MAQTFKPVQIPAPVRESIERIRERNARPVFFEPDHQRQHLVQLVMLILLLASGLSW